MVFSNRQKQTSINFDTLIYDACIIPREEDIDFQRNTREKCGLRRLEFSLNSINKTQKNNCFISFARIYFMDKRFYCNCT